MARTDLTLQTTQVLLVATFIGITAYYNYVLIRKSLDILFWATVASVPLIGLKNSSRFLSSHLSNTRTIKRPQILLLLFVMLKGIVYDRSAKMILMLELAVLYFVIEMTLRRSAFSNSLKVFLVSVVVGTMVVSSLHSIVMELRYVALTFNVKTLATAQNIEYVQNLITPNIDKFFNQLKQRRELLQQFSECGVNLESITLDTLRGASLHDGYRLAVCLGKGYKRQLMTLAEASKPYIIKAVKKMLLLAESSVGAISRFLTFTSTVYIMTKRSIQPMRVIEVFLDLVDDTGYLNAEFKEIFDSLLAYNAQKIVVSCMATFIAFSLFSLHITVIPTILSGLIVIIPAIPHYTIPAIGVVELFLNHKPYWYIILFAVAFDRLRVYCNNMITLKVSLINRTAFLRHVRV